MREVVRLLEGLDLRLLDKQLTTLHKVEAGAEPQNETERAHIAGLCEFLSKLYNTMKDADGS